MYNVNRAARLHNFSILGDHRPRLYIVGVMNHGYLVGGKGDHLPERTDSFRPNR